MVPLPDEAAEKTREALEKKNSGFTLYGALSKSGKGTHKPFLC